MIDQRVDKDERRIQSLIASLRRAWAGERHSAALRESRDQGIRRAAEASMGDGRGVATIDGA